MSHDAGLHDAGLHDADVVDANVDDADIDRSGLPVVDLPDTDLPDTDLPGTGAVDTGPADFEIQDLKDQRDLLLLSLEDLQREHDAGDLSDRDYEVLRDRYTARTASILRALQRSSVNPNASQGPSATAQEPPQGDSDAALDGAPSFASTTYENAPSQVSGEADVEAEAEVEAGAAARTVDASLSKSKNPRSARTVRRRRTMAVMGVLMIVAAISIVLVSRGTSTRLPGETATGSLSLSRQQSLERTLSQAQTLESNGSVAEALTLYQQVLKQVPDQEQALAESGWLEFEAGVDAKKATLLSQGQSEEQKAEDVDSTAYTPHLYLGSMYLVEGENSNAVSQYRLFLADNPPNSVVKPALPFIDRAFSKSGLTPPSLPAGS